MKVAVVGSGVSGLVAAYRLQQVHDVTLYEGSSRLGGHAHTVDVDEGERRIPVDTGFLVCNRATYPNFIQLLQELDVPLVDSDMSFSVSSRLRGFEYSGRGLDTLFAQRRNLLRPRFHRMVRDILRFYREAPQLLEASPDLTMGTWLGQRGYSQQFIDDHLTPMIRAVWSARRDVAVEFPAPFLVQFFHNHGFLTAGEQLPWLTIPGGSRRYVDAIARRLTGRVRTSCAVQRVSRSKNGSVSRLTVHAQGSAPEVYDHVVMACHSDQALAALEAPTPLESELLGAIEYESNCAILHTDETVMPQRKKVWSSWNVHLDGRSETGACLTYWLNSLQPLETRRNYFVTLNHQEAIHSRHVIRTFDYAHPVFTSEWVKRQSRHAELIDHEGISYCGAYWRYGFHEDGVVSALRVSDRLASSQLSRVA